MFVSRTAAGASILALATFACSRGSAPERKAPSSATAVTTTPAPSRSAAALLGSASGAAASNGSAPGGTSPKRQRCHPSNPSMARFWSELSKQDLKALVEGHVAGATQGESGCVLAAFMSGVNVLSFTAQAPKLKPLKPNWKGGDTAEPPPALGPELREVMPDVGQPKPLLQQKFEDGEGNFLTRRLYRTKDGRFVLVLEYSG